MSENKVLFLKQTNYHYAVYIQPFITKDNKIIRRAFIVLKNSYNVIIHFTNFHKYIDTYMNKPVVPLKSCPDKKMSYICDMLNYILIENGKRYRVDNVLNITHNQLQDFFDFFCLKKLRNNMNEEYKGEQSISKCLNTVTSFMVALKRKYKTYMDISETELLKTIDIISPYGKKKIVPNFKVKIQYSHHKIFRDINTKIVEAIINAALACNPMIALAIALQAFAGLRPGEVCNLRQTNSPLGPGILFTFLGTKLTKVELDLTKELTLRSDGVITGGIKKERWQKIYPVFLNSFYQLYQAHLKLLREKGFEEEYAPLFVNRNGKAMTYSNYRDQFIKLIDEVVIPELQVSKDINCRYYANLLLENRLGLHAFRHWFTVFLVLNGEDIAQIQYWRGDGNPNSAATYVADKGELNQKYKESNNNFFNFLTNSSS